ncbi:MAG: fimbrillin family protein, partial [Alistipes onderdonkii]
GRGEKRGYPIFGTCRDALYHVMSQLTIVLTNNSDAPVTGVTVGGLVPTAVVDFTVPSAAAKSGAAAADVEAFEVTADAAYRAILVPQQATLTVTVATGDGKSRSKTLSSAQLESGKRYDMSVVVTNIDIDVELSGERRRLGRRRFARW